MNILLIGGGGREHSLTYAISKSASCTRLYCFPGNPGIAKIAELVDAKIDDYVDIVSICKLKEIDLVVIGPEQPLAEGLSDYLRLNNINVFGPSKYAAQLETSKDFAKSIMLKNNIPTAAYRSFNLSQYDEAHQYLDLHSLPIVLKADGLAAGKGVIIADSHKLAHDALNDIFNGEFGSAGSKVVVEEFLIGEEASIFAVCDGSNYIVLSTAQDHKRIFDGDKGKNTGGMGAYSPAPIVTDEVMVKVKHQIIEPMLKAMLDEGHPFVGCLYCGVMIHNGNPKVVEFNVRFGDPETQVVLPLIEGDFVKLLYSAAIGNLDINAIQISDKKFATCVVLASDGYPDNFQKGFEITGIEQAEELGAIVFHAGTKYENEKLVSSGGRVLGVTCLGSTLKNAVDNTYNAADKINFSNKYCRRDIGKKAL